MKEIFSATFPGARGGAVTVTGSKRRFYGPYAQKRLVPCSTFKLVLGLVGLETGVIPSATTRWRWNGEKTGRAEWRRDMDLTVALQESAEWYFREVARKLGEKRLREAVAQLGYGEGWKGKRPEDAWHDGSLLVSPQEQAHLAQKLALGSLPFDPAHQTAVRECLRVEKTGSWGLWGKTGSGPKEADGRSLGWYVGAYTDKGVAVAFAVVQHAPGSFGPAVRAKVAERLSSS